MKKIAIFLLTSFASIVFMSMQMNAEQETEFCKSLKIMVASSQENFEPIKKERKSGVLDLYYTSNIVLPTSIDTRIVLTGETWYVSCKLQEKTDLDAINKNYKQLSSILQGCLKNFKMSNTSAGKYHSLVFKDMTDKECGASVKLSVAENAAKAGYYKIMLTILPN